MLTIIKSGIRSLASKAQSRNASKSVTSADFRTPEAMDKMLLALHDSSITAVDASFQNLGDKNASTLLQSLPDHILQVNLAHNGLSDAIVPSVTKILREGTELPTFH